MQDAPDKRGSRAEDLAYQERALQGTSRTFALTIPQLPQPLKTIVGNAYLLCRIADTIEDSDTLTLDEKQRFAQEFVAVVAGEASPEAFGTELAPRLEGCTLEAEKDLVENTPAVIRVTHSFDPEDRQALHRCVRIMSEGMELFQEGQFTAGLRDQAHLDDYCYHVAGVVGEMLTELFCHHCRAVEGNADRLRALAVSFGEGLQMVNILKDIWADKERNVCWLPRDLFDRRGFDLADLSHDNHGEAFQEGLLELVGVAHGHLRNALDYTLLIPPSEKGVRLFCLWALGMAVLTLQRIRKNPGFSSGDEVKISRRSVRATVLTTRLIGGSNALLRWTFNRAAAGLPSA